MRTLVDWLEMIHPNKTPTTQMSEWELGVQAGQRMLIEQIKIKLNTEGVNDDEVK